VNPTPEINTSSPTFSARILSSVKGKLNLIMVILELRQRFLRGGSSFKIKGVVFPS
jgi:hypothetical protein